MIKFTLKSVVLTVFLLCVVFFGMQTAQQGLIKMKGYNDPSIEHVINVSKTSDGQVEAAVLGSKKVVDIDEKQQFLEKRKAFNFFSSLGESLAQGVKSTIGKALEAIHHLLN
ncbi:DUF3679 domain-containing protein [Priestia aryabhattai]|jgi:hypothetical protein|uniref:DUF3679 domain-containing protein n=1 Tax=Priestia megaterium TaxID=1404 RepID=UPI0039B927D8